MLDGITPLHLVIVLVIALVILGPGKLPEAGAALGRSIREFRSSMSDQPEPQPAAQAVAAAPVAAAVPVAAPAVAPVAQPAAPVSPAAPGPVDGPTTTAG
jgi:sec-independent protein translocase protein TatA